MIQIRKKYTNEIMLEIDTLIYADLTGANLRDANLIGVNLMGASLIGVNLMDCHMQIQGTQHNFIGFLGRIQIGCYYYSIEYWKIMYDTIGRSENYTEQQIKEYYGYIKTYEKMYQDYNRLYKTREVKE